MRLLFLFQNSVGINRSAWFLILKAAAICVLYCWAISPILTQIMVIYVGVGGTNSGILVPDELSGFNGFRQV